jgi:branched-chain amino acid transport system ATP-binding protein
MLKISSLDVAYGGLRALSGISLEAPSGQFVAVVGPNGAGKTTLFKSISGTVEPATGA